MDCIGCTLVKLEKNNVCVMSKWESKQKVIIGESEGDGDFFCTIPSSTTLQLFRFLNYKI